MKQAFAALLLCCAGLCPVAQAGEATLPALRHGYVDNRYGQLHFSIATPTHPSGLPPIVLFHQSPNSSAEFDLLVQELGRSRVAIAVDTPGYGGSDGPKIIPSIEDYAGAIADGLKAQGYGPTRRVDLFGYHTGSKIAVELALREPRMVRSVALSGIYDPPGEKLAQALAGLHHPQSTDDLFATFIERLPRMKAYYTAMGVPDDRWAKIRIDSLRPMERQEYGHEAAFRYAPKFLSRMKQVRQPVLLLPMDDGLAAATIAAKPAFSNAYVAQQTFSAGGFFTQAPGIAVALNQFAKSVK